MENSDGLFQFDHKLILSIRNTFLTGASFWQWLSILWAYGRYIEWKYIPKVIFIALFSIINTFLNLVESVLYPEHIINAVPLPEDPVFIIGHPRTGTTYLHNLLATDTSSFYYCTTFCTGFSGCFLWFERWGSVLLKNALPPTRPMDAVPMGMDLPQEDEFAIALLSHGASYYMASVFAKQGALFRKYLTFDPQDGATPEDEERWTRSFLFLVRKLVLREKHVNSNPYQRRLLLKTPIHAARVPILRRLFPKATFVYLHRDPYKVVQSTAHLVNTMLCYLRLNSPTDAEINEHIYFQFQYLWESYNAAALTDKSKRRQVASDIIELGYNDIVKDPLPAIKQIYKLAGITWTDDIAKRYEAEVASLSGYKVNKFVDLPDDIRASIRTHCKEYFEAFGYPM